jgi:hypothetical protein
MSRVVIRACMLESNVVLQGICSFFKFSLWLQGGIQSCAPHPKVSFVLAGASDNKVSVRTKHTHTHTARAAVLRRYFAFARNFRICFFCMCYNGITDNVFIGSCPCVAPSVHLASCAHTHATQQHCMSATMFPLQSTVSSLHTFIKLQPARSSQ